jgi:hypothetical protein
VTETNVQEERSELYIKLFITARASGLMGALGPERWQTLCTLATYMDENGECYPSIEQIAEDLGLSQTAAGRRLKDLCDFRWNGRPIVTRVKRKSKGGQWAHYRYTIHPESHLSIFDESDSDERRRIASIPRRSEMYREWSFKVKRRDGFTCQKCGKRGGVLHSHHIESWDQNPELRFNIENGITLCEDCHFEFHKKYGKGKNTREQFARWAE